MLHKVLGSWASAVQSKSQGSPRCSVLWGLLGSVQLGVLVPEQGSVAGQVVDVSALGHFSAWLSSEGWAWCADGTLAIKWSKNVSGVFLVGFANRFCQFLQKNYVICGKAWSLTRWHFSVAQACRSLCALLCEFYHFSFFFFSPPALVSFSVLLWIFRHAQKVTVLSAFSSTSLDWITTCAWQILIVFSS